MFNEKYIISEFYDFSVDRNIIKEAEEKHIPVVLSGILQKADVQNRNGRVYPYNILKREADKYQEVVNDRRALGECVPAGTGIYTINGWKNIEDIKKNDKIHTLNIETNNIEVQNVTNTIKKHYDDDLLHIYNDVNLDMIITKKHKIVLWDINDKSSVLIAEDFCDKIKNDDFYINNSYIKYSVDYKGDLSNVHRIDLNSRDIKYEKVPFNDYVYCVSIPNKTWLMKYNNMVSWTHNCDHPDSAVVSLSNVSHMITDMWWEKDTLLGKVELTETPAGNILKGLLKSGVKLGISSRGIGSVKKVGGNDVVQEDFELIAFDFVSSPSTPGAYLFKESRSWGLTKLTNEHIKVIKASDLKDACNIINETVKNNDKFNRLLEISKDNFWHL